MASDKQATKRQVTVFAGVVIIAIAIGLMLIPVSATDDYGNPNKACDGPGVFGAISHEGNPRRCPDAGWDQFWSLSPVLILGVACIIGGLLFFKPNSKDAPPAKPTPANLIPGRPAATSATKNPASVADQLHRLKGLHDEGILTDDEYETKRKALTDKL